MNIFKNLSIPSNKRHYRHELDGLRALAVIAVIINHFEKTLLPSGYLGVDIFFVLSGFVITGSLMNREAESLRQFIVQFYVRRIKRLLPALILVSLVTGIATIILVYAPGASINTGLFSLFGFSNHYLLNTSTDYFASSTALNTFTHTWSLGVEEQFYFIFPILFWLTTIRRKTKNSKLLLGVIGVLSVLSLALFIYLSISNPSAAYFLMFARFWELGLGCLTYIFITKTASRNGYNLPSLPILFLLCAALFIPAEYKITNTISVVVLTTLLVIHMKPGQYTYKLFTQKYLVAIGILSYALYLWHWPILALSRWTVGIHWYTVLWQVPLMLILSLLTFHYIEDVLRKATWSSRNRNTIGLGLAGSLLAIGILSSTYAMRDHLSMRYFPWKNLTPVVRNLACHLPKSADPIQDCLCNDQKDKNAIYIIGDSHAGNLVPSVKEAVGDKLSVRYLSDRALVFSIFDSKDCGGTNCSDNEFQSRLDFFNRDLKKGDVVMFSMARDRIYDLTITFPEDRMKSIMDKNLEFLQNKLKILADVVTSYDATFILVDDIPKLCEIYDTEVRNNPMNPCPIDQSISLKDRQPLTEIYKSLVTDNTLYFDPHPTLCPEKTCFAHFDGTLLYTDSSPHFAEFNASPLTAFFKLAFTELHLLKGQKGNDNP